MAGPLIAPVKPDVLGTSLKGNNTEGENCVFWVVTQRVVVTPYRRFGTTYRSHLQGYPWPLKIGPDRLSRNVGKELSLIARTQFSFASRRKPEITVFVGVGEQIAEGVIWT